jgi:hypothetical protein
MTEQCISDLLDKAGKEDVVQPVILVQPLSYISPVSAANLDSAEASSEYQCRICLEDAERKDLIAPCSCSGSSKWVHRRCLDQWRTTREDRAFARCTECLESYTLININDNAEARARRKRKYYWALAKDFGGAFVLTQSIIIISALFIYGCDWKQHFIENFQAKDHPKLFYYGMGLLLDLAILGMFAFFSGSGNYCNDCNDSGSCGHVYCFDCNFGSCECGEAAIVIVFIIIVAFILLGLVALVVGGVAFVQRAVQRHAHILQKRELAQDIVVADLANDATDIEAPALTISTPTHAYIALNPLHGGHTLPNDLSQGDRNRQDYHLSERSTGSTSGRYPQMSREQRRELADLGLL